MATKATRSRGQNFSLEDCHTLLDIVMEYKDVIENKGTDLVIWREKDAAWDEVVATYNAATMQNRTKIMLRSKYEKLKGQARSDIAKERQRRLQTGGGPFKETPSPSAELTEKIRGLIPLSVEGLPSVFDSDRIIRPPQSEPLSKVVQLEEEDSEVDDELENFEFSDDNILGILDEPTRPNGPAQRPDLQAGCSGSGLGDHALSKPRGTKRSTESDSDWRSYSPAMLKRPKHDLLKTPVVNGDDDIQRTERRVFILPDKLLARRRPAVPLKQAVALSASTERFSKLADTKRDLADAQQTALLKEHEINLRIKEATLEEIQLDIKMKKLRYEATLESIQLDIKIKKLRYEKMQKGELPNDE